MGCSSPGSYNPERESNPVIGMDKPAVSVFGMKLGWAAVVIWFSANLLSQAVYLGFNGEPYDANAMLSAIGAWYWLFIGIELGIWLLLGALLWKKVRPRWVEEPVSETA